jgi:hypothetical protein
MMMKMAVVAIPILLLTASAAGASPQVAAPAPLVNLAVGGYSLAIWPYTFQGPGEPGTPSDPINLIFPGVDPRAIRQAMMAIDPTTRSAFPPIAPFTCRWADAMGNEQASWADAEGWVGGEVQLGCVGEGAPLGNPFRFHLRLFRHGDVTLGAAHFEYLIKDTAEHEALAWDFARTFVMYDMVRSGILTAAPAAVPLIAPGTFKSVNGDVYDGLVRGGATGILSLAGLPMKPVLDRTPVPIPTNGVAMVLVPGVQFDPVQDKIRTVADVTYNVVAPKPFCASGPADYVLLQGPVHLEMRVHTNPSGKYERNYAVSGTLSVTPLAVTASGLAPSGSPVPAVVAEVHRALLTDNYGQVTEQLSRVLLGNPPQLLATFLAAGQHDKFSTVLSCGAP